MALFPDITSDKVIAVDDRLRLDATNSIVTPDEAALTSVEIEPEAGAGFISVFDSNSRNWYLDYQYATDGTKVVTCRVDNGSGPVTTSLSIEVLTEADDKLFSDDQDLRTLETDILKYLPEGRTSFKYVHREAQRQILEYFYKIGVTKINGDKLTKDEVLDVEEVRQWSKYLVYRLIYEDLSTVPGDQYDYTSQRLLKEENEARHRASIKLDLNGDGTTDSREGVDITWRRLDRV